MISAIVPQAPEKIDKIHQIGAGQGWWKNARSQIRCKKICKCNKAYPSFLFLRWDLTCNYEIKSNPSEDLDSVVVIDAEEVHENKANGDEHPHKTDCEEKLCGHKEC